MKTTIGIYELRRAALKSSFSNLFPEHRELFEAYSAKPGCGDCWRNLLQAIAQDVERIRSYFGDVEVDLGEQPPARQPSQVTATTVVVNCRVEDLQDSIDKLCAQNSGAKTFYLAMWMREVTMVVDVVDLPSQGSRHFVVDCRVEALQDKLSELDQRERGPKQIAMCRYQDDVVAVVTAF